MTDNNIYPRETEKQARKTAWLVAGVLLLFAVWNYHRERMTFVIVFASLASALILISLTMPTVTKLFHFWWMRVAAVLGWVNSRILLGLVFYCILAPYNLVGRIVGRDPLKRRRPKSQSYWQPRKLTRQTREQFEHPF